MIEWIRFGISALLMLCGLFVILISVLGVFRFRFVLNRMHCAAMIDTLGALFVIASLMMAFGVSAALWKLFAVLVFLWISSPLSSHMVSRMELLTDRSATKHMEVDTQEDLDDIL